MRAEVDNQGSRPPFSVAVLNLTGDLTVGHIIRTADVFGCSSVYCMGLKKFDIRSSVGLHKKSFVMRVDCTETEGGADGGKGMFSAEKFWNAVREFGLFPIFVDPSVGVRGGGEGGASERGMCVEIELECFSLPALIACLGGERGTSSLEKETASRLTPCFVFGHDMPLSFLWEGKGVEEKEAPFADWHHWLLSEMPPREGKAGPLNCSGGVETERRTDEKEETGERNMKLSADAFHSNFAEGKESSSSWSERFGKNRIACLRRAVRQGALTLFLSFFPPGFSPSVKVLEGDREEKPNGRREGREQEGQCRRERDDESQLMKWGDNEPCSGKKRNMNVQTEGESKSVRVTGEEPESMQKREKEVEGVGGSSGSFEGPNEREREKEKGAVSSVRTDVPSSTRRETLLRAPVTSVAACVIWTAFRQSIQMMACGPSQHTSDVKRKGPVEGSMEDDVRRGGDVSFPPPQRLLEGAVSWSAVDTGRQGKRTDEYGCERPKGFGQKID
uniref:Uncharacterized protein n=1 Tax=Chromera velia CCMP2878 TaxID=1169474 RepID=A0A0G4G166_9ALVE|eukprot:Cvel_19705.t1-p1 / transcript=Cvel_19705.t1 / gene=Cvel_19705 / organism=Chromera_velia_CCMP2878 / gene_product=hypothetical protein / transcript_product=hypothetical protein / location=Cvel_scaffold1720:27453-29583(+) / protein_length=502 / sequence_SO=supercontig / SO=protein_coding / is_pseudo=false